MDLLARLNPRRHLAAAIGWSMLAVVVLASVVAGELAASEAERAARQSTERLMAQFASQVDRGLDMNLRNRLSMVQVTAAQIAASNDKGAAALRRHLDAVQAQFPEFAWLGVADVHGKVMTATGGVMQGHSVARRRWFVAAHSGAFLGDAREATPQDEQPAGRIEDQRLRIVEAAAPIRLADGRLAGVVGARLAWDWIERLQAELLGSLDRARSLQLVLADHEGVVMAGPPRWLGRKLALSDDLSEGGVYIVGRQRSENATGTGLGWTVAVRQAAGPALLPARGLRRTVFATVLLAGAVAALVALLVTHWLTRRLTSLAAEATSVRQGQSTGIRPPAGADEVSRIGATMAELVGHLLDEKAALTQLNAELDARVADRTARIERLADEARHAAVTRERLRLARDLHDTLAHSLMALLAQLRLVRKLKDKLPADELAAELDRAEEVAASGLAEARAAITQMRHGTVREHGLASALRDLLTRFGERSGVAATLQAHGAAAELADERAETLYRIVEEALRNVERHAQAQAVVVEIADEASAGGATAQRASVSVRDDGVGFDVSAPYPGHYGMLGMREQAALIDAELVIRSAPGSGTEIRLSFAA